MWVLRHGKSHPDRPGWLPSPMRFDHLHSFNSTMQSFDLDHFLTVWKMTRMISGTYLVHVLPTHVLPVFADPDSEVKEVELQKKKMASEAYQYWSV